MNKPALIFSAFLSAIILTIIGGVIYTVRGAESAQASQTEEIVQTKQIVQTESIEQAISLDPVLEQEILTREAAYRELIAQANVRLAEQQLMITATQASAPDAVVLQITAEEAAVFASRHIGKTSIYSIEGVNFNGNMVYKVTFTKGDVVYVSLYGDIVSVELAPRQSDDGKIVASSGEHSNDHDDGGEDDDD